MVEKKKKRCGKSEVLTKTEKLFLEKVSLGITTPKKLMLSTKLKKTRVYKVLADLKRKGYLKNTMENTDPTIPYKKGNYVRLHGVHFNIKILYQDERYSKIRNNNNRIIKWVGGHKLVLYKNNIDLYGKCSFEASFVEKAFFDSLAYWDKLIARLESEYKVILTKPRSQNIKVCMIHYADVNNNIAKECVLQGGDGLHLYGREDGKLWCLVDCSMGRFELEFVHPETAKEDFEKVVGRHINDWRYNEPPTNTEIMAILRDIVAANKETANGLSAVVQLLSKSQSISEPKGELEHEKPTYIG